MPIGIRILIVEDNVDFRLDLEEFFELEGFQVSTAADGREALAHMAKLQFEVIVSDYEMPNLDGYRFYQTLRARENTLRLPFILISGANPPAVEGDSNFRCLKKPFSVEDLMTVVAHLVAQRRSEDQRAAD